MEVEQRIFVFYWKYSHRNHSSHQNDKDINITAEKYARVSNKKNY